MSILKIAIKILGVSVLATIVYVIGSAVLPFSESFREAMQNSDPINLVYLLFVHVWLTGSVYYIGKNAEWKGSFFIGLLFYTYVGIYSVMTQIETIFFQDTFDILSKYDGWWIMLANVFPLIVIVPLASKIRNNRLSKENLKINIRPGTILQKVAFLAVLYMVIYFLFGYFVAWQFTDLRLFYTGSPEKESFLSIMAGNIQNSSIVPFQLLRGILFSIFILPVVFIFREKRKELFISLILIYTSTAIVLIIPNSLFPDTVRWAHFIEMISSMSLFSLLTWLVWRN